jgi:hypothetical protein
MLPDEDYLLSLGRLSYSLARLESVSLDELAQLPGLPPALAPRKLAGKSVEAIARALADPANTGKVADSTTRDRLRATGEELATAARLRHAIIHARAAHEGEEIRLHRRSGDQANAADITTAWLERAQADVDDALRQILRTRSAAA